MSVKGCFDRHYFGGQSVHGLGRDSPAIVHNLKSRGVADFHNMSMITSLVWLSMLIITLTSAVYLSIADGFSLMLSPTYIYVFFPLCMVQTRSAS
jgi:hypothetical protein